MTVNGLYLSHQEELKISKIIESFFNSEIGKKIKKKTGRKANEN